MNDTNRISYVDLSAQWRDERDELLPIIESVLSVGQYVGGSEIVRFEEEIAEYIGVSHVVSLNSGTDALIHGLAAIDVGLGDEVITPANSFVASTAAIIQRNARPVFVDVESDQNIDTSLIEAAINAKTKAIMPVHLTGRVANMKRIMEVADSYNISVIEDAAQAIGSEHYGRPSGSWGRLACFSAHPLKNLNAMGDAGYVATDDSEIASRIRLTRNHGLTGRDAVQMFGQVSRLDTIQAAVLRYRLRRLPKVIELRQRNAELYRETLNPEFVVVPPDREYEFNTWHTFVIQVDRRNDLKEHLASKGVETSIHYPIPIHMQPAASGLGYRQGDLPVTECQAERILTLPTHQYLSEGQVRHVAMLINKFCEKH